VPQNILFEIINHRGNYYEIHINNSSLITVEPAFLLLKHLFLPLVEIEALAHTEGRLHDREITSDLPGKIKGEGSVGHAFEQPTIPKNMKPTTLHIALPIIWRKRIRQQI